MFWKKPKAMLDRKNFSYGFGTENRVKNNSRKLKMVDGELFIDDILFDKKDCPEIYDLAICLAFCTHEFASSIGVKS